MIAELKEALNDLSDLSTALGEADAPLETLKMFHHRMTAAYQDKHIDDVDPLAVEDLEEAAILLGDSVAMMRQTIDGPLATLIDEARDLATYCRDLFDSCEPGDLSGEDTEAQRLARSLLRQLPIGVDPEKAS